jgi:hypothetical protein
MKTIKISACGQLQRASVAAAPFFQYDYGLNPKIKFNQSSSM